MHALLLPPFDPYPPRQADVFAMLVSVETSGGGSFFFAPTCLFA